MFAIGGSAIVNLKIYKSIQKVKGRWTGKSCSQIPSYLNLDNYSRDALFERLTVWALRRNSSPWRKRFLEYGTPPYAVGLTGNLSHSETDVLGNYRMCCEISAYSFRYVLSKYSINLPKFLKILTRRLFLKVYILRYTVKD